MARNDHDDDKRASGSGRDSERVSYGKTSDFSTTSVLSEDGKFFGIKVSKETGKNLDTLYPMGLVWVTDFVEKNVAHLDPKLAATIVYGTAFSKQLVDFGQQTVDTTKQLNDLHVAVAPLAKVSKNSAALSGDNEVITNTRAKINGVFWQKTGDIASSTIGVLPAIWGRLTGAKERQEALQYERELKLAKTPKERADVMAKRLSGGYAAKGAETLTVQEMEQAKRELIAGEEKAYMDAFKGWADKNRSDVSRKIGAIISDTGLNATNLDSQLNELEKLGVDVSGNRTKLDRHYNASYRTKTTSGNSIEDEVIKNLKDSFKDTRSKNKMIDDALRVQYGQTEGNPWDITFLSAAQRSSKAKDDKSILTRKEIIGQDIRKLDEDQRRLEQERRDKEKQMGMDGTSNRLLMTTAAGLGAGVVSDMVSSALGGDAKARFARPLALDKILHLRRSLEAPKDNPSWTPPDRVPAFNSSGSGNHKNGDDDDNRSMSYAEFIHNVFQQHQRDSHFGSIGDRTFQHLDAVHWDDEKIQKLNDADLSSYEYAIKIISKRVKDGRMDAIALVDLVGDHHGKKIVRSDGRSFGPISGGKTEEEIKASIEKLVDEKTAILHTATVMTDEQINEKLGNFVFSVEDLKAALTSDTIAAEQKSMMFITFSDLLGSDVKLCKMLGISEERCHQLREQSRETFNKYLDASVDVLAELVEKNPELLKEKLKMTAQEEALITSLEKRMKEGPHAEDVTKDRDELERLKILVENANMALQDTPVEAKSEEQQSFWQRVVATAKGERKEKASLKDKDGDDYHEERRGSNADDDRRPAARSSRNPLEEMGYDGEESSARRRMEHSERSHDREDSYTDRGYDSENEDTPSHAARVGRKTAGNYREEYGNNYSSPHEKSFAESVPSRRKNWRDEELGDDSLGFADRHRKRGTDWEEHLSK